MRRVSAALSFIVVAASAISGCTDAHDEGTLSDDGQVAIDLGSIKPSVALTGPLNQWQWIDIPGNECGDGTQTGVVVNKGSGTDLVIWMQGGGFCFDQFTCNLRIGEFGFVQNYKKFGQAEWANIQSWQGQSGILNRNDSTNPYKSSTFVFVPYCTADLHSGNTTQNWPNGFKMRYSGRKNLTNIVTEVVGSFPNPSRVTVYGESAGAYGATLNFFRFKNAYPTKRVDLIADAGPYLNGSMAIVQGTPVWGLASAWPSGCTTCASDFESIYTYNATTSRRPASRTSATTKT